MITKTVQRSEDLFIEFTPQELLQLGCKVGDKFTCKVEGNSIVLTKYAEIELDMADWPQEVLLHIISKSVEQDISVNKVIEQLLTDGLEHFTSNQNE